MNFTTSMWNQPTTYTVLWNLLKATTKTKGTQHEWIINNRRLLLQSALCVPFLSRWLTDRCHQKERGAGDEVMEDVCMIGWGRGFSLSLFLLANLEPSDQSNTSVKPEVDSRQWPLTSDKLSRLLYQLVWFSGQFQCEVEALKKGWDTLSFWKKKKMKLNRPLLCNCQVRLGKKC